MRDVASRLHRADLIHWPLVFTWYLRLKGLDSKIQAGEFKLTSLMSLPELVQSLTHGVADVLVTIPEGFRVEEVAAQMAASLVVANDGQDKESQISQDRLEWAENFVTLAKPFEGYLFPDTYFIPHSASPSAVITLMRDNFDRRLTDRLTQEVKDQDLTLSEAVTLASIVEREVRYEADRPIVAGILLSRYRQGTLLGADATVQYSLGFSPEENTWWRKNLTGQDLEVDSPYNTRKYPNLPPTPICNPGLAAIEAVIYPKKTNYFYYLSDRDGRMHYAITSEEHQENIRQHLEGIPDNG